MPGPYPLSTLAPVIGPAGISAPAYSDILASQQASYRLIYGADVDLASDTQDGQLLAIESSAINDLNNAIIDCFNAFSPATAQGAGLSSVVKINGVRRQNPSFSTVLVTLVGQVGTVIPSGIVQDAFGNRWDLPPNVVIPNAGTISVTATCETPGATAAAPATVTGIVTIIPGWQSVTNAAAATPGAPVEDDAQLRTRQAVSTSLPAQTPLAAILGAVANVAGVDRYAIYENDSDSTDANGLPDHSIAVVVDGGDAVTIATVISEKKNPGTGTFGSTSEVIIDPAGVPNTIDFFFLTDIPIHVLITLNPLTGFASTTATMIQTVVAAYIQALNIGEYDYLGRLGSPVNLSGTVAVANSGGLTQAQLDALSATYDIPMPNGIAQARSDMTATGGPYNAGATSIDVVNADSIAPGQTLFLTLDDSVTWQVACTGVTPGTPPEAAVAFTPAIPFGRSVQNGALVYVVGDLKIAFNEAAGGIAGNVIVNVT